VAITMAMASSMFLSPLQNLWRSQFPKPLYMPTCKFSWISKNHCCGYRYGFGTINCFVLTPKPTKEQFPSLCTCPLGSLFWLTPSYTRLTNQFPKLGGPPLKMAKNIFSPIITKLSGLVNIGLNRMYTKFDGENLIRNWLFPSVTTKIWVS
jgi:hypothetical protein